MMQNTHFRMASNENSCRHKEVKNCKKYEAYCCWWMYFKAKKTWERDSCGCIKDGYWFEWIWTVHFVHLGCIEWACTRVVHNWAIDVGGWVNTFSVHDMRWKFSGCCVCSIKCHERSWVVKWAWSCGHEPGLCLSKIDKVWHTAVHWERQENFLYVYCDQLVILQRWVASGNKGTESMIRHPICVQLGKEAE